MRARLVVPVVTLLLGGGIGFGVCWWVRPTPAPVAATDPPAASDEVVVEVRVKLPPGALRRNEFSPPASTLCQNALVNTGEPLDLAVEGAGFFQVQLPNGDIAYTRGGAFGLNTNGGIVTKQGYSLMPSISIPQDTVDVTVATDGTVRVRGAAEATASTVGQITLVRFDNPGWLRLDAEGLWAETPASGSAYMGTAGMDKFGLVRQGFRERQPGEYAAALIDLVRALAGEDGRVRVKTER